MGSYSQFQIPIIVFSISAEFEKGTEEWFLISEQVRDACENFGCFEIRYDKIPTQLRQDTFCNIRELFRLPFETKIKNFNPKPYHGYFGPNDFVPLYESFGLEDASNYNSITKFADLMWPEIKDVHLHHSFCQTIDSMMKQVDELNCIIWSMIIDSYKLGDKMQTIMEYYTLLRVMKYKAPSPDKENMEALLPHTDKLPCVILCQEQVSGLEIETKNGQWIKWFPSSSDSFIFLIGDPLMVWSNGRMHAVKHRVVMSGVEDRYSFGAFVAPVEGVVVKVQKELVDEEHPTFSMYHSNKW